jgi:hypothetical protein
MPFSFRQEAASRRRAASVVVVEVVGVSEVLEVVVDELEASIEKYFVPVG